MPVEEYVKAMQRQLAILIGFARQTNELDLAGCVMMEMRGMQDAGWNTGATAFEVHDELSALCTLDRPLTRQEFRSALALYMQLAEAGGVYEGLKSMLQIIELKPYSMWPFQPLVRHRVNPPAVIGPNANAMFRDLATVADGVGMTKLSELLATTFRDDIRNGVAHADYIIWNNNLRLRRRNGGQVVVLTLQEVGDAMGIGLNFFLLLRGAVEELFGHSDPGAQSSAGLASTFRPRGMWNGAPMAASASAMRRGITTRRPIAANSGSTTGWAGRFLPSS